MSPGREISKYQGYWEDLWFLSSEKANHWPRNPLPHLRMRNIPARHYIPTPQPQTDEAEQGSLQYRCSLLESGQRRRVSPAAFFWTWISLAMHMSLCSAGPQTVRGTTSLHGVQVLVQRPYSRDEDSEVSDSTDSKRHKWDWNSVIETPT